MSKVVTDKIQKAGGAEFTLPAEDGPAGSTLQTNGAGQLAFVAPATAAGASLINSNTTAVDKGVYLADTATAPFNVYLPAAPTLGAKVTIGDASGTFASKPLCVKAQGLKIMGLTEDLYLNINNVSVTLTYSNAAKGWRVL
jgi:hypothetical protein